MIALPLRPRHRQESGIAAAGRLAHRGTPYGTSLSFATTTHLWPLPDPPSRNSRSATSRTGTARSIPGRALASSVSGSPHQGPGTGLPPPISTSVPGTPARPVALRAPASRRPARLALSPTQSGNINTNNNRRQVGPLQAIAPGPVQAIVFTRSTAAAPGHRPGGVEGPRPVRPGPVRATTPVAQVRCTAPSSRPARRQPPLPVDRIPRFVNPRAEALA